MDKCQGVDTNPGSVGICATKQTREVVIRRQFLYDSNKIHLILFTYYRLKALLNCLKTIPDLRKCKWNMTAPV